MYYTNAAARRESRNGPDARTKTDAKGRFTLRILKGQKGVLYGVTYSFERNDTPCPKMEHLLYTSNDDLETPEIFIDASSDQADHELRFPFPFCPGRYPAYKRVK